MLRRNGAGQETMESVQKRERKSMWLCGPIRAKRNLNLSRLQAELFQLLDAGVTR